MQISLNKKLSCSVLVIMLLAITSCSKEDPKITHYQLEGTWQLYRTYTGVMDSIYDRSSDNQIVFTPKFYWRYMDGAATDSGSYSLTNTLDTKDGFSASITYMTEPSETITLVKDTLSVAYPGVIASGAVYIKTDDSAPVN